ncbi:YihY/virulence factor BrkB family protein [Mangrovibrevibacter kandeliae]|uniref:YihY/virulence factor BrkB family protein n=1 Tax=Mangrovibrevibacter kandeliae TaxID=2968473 RepID=UPI002118DC7C|nr:MULTISPECIES: YihY/virulence factor BrkB family protein [unclassified Aurantimonas]MCQ8784189.1 YihY/virulence factor BrkB family protein [Aurantimonas sp. CSK15Z-1]MCW4116969.1 YihY/virulence factor BrkB family protein [Aurantimonas sp. MSK8Z-1]
MSLRFAPNSTEETRRRASEPGRGRDAALPSQIPWKGWKDILYRIYLSFFEDRVMLIAAGATFYLLLALFPALAVFVSLYGFVSDPVTIRDHIAFIGQFLPPAGTELLQGQLETLTSQDPASLSLGFLTGLLFSLWSANNGIKTLFEAMNVAYGEQEERSFLKLNAVAFCFTLGAVLLGIFMIAIIGVVPIVMNLLGLQSLTDWLIAAMRWPVAFALIVGAIAFVYRFGPSRNRARWSWVILGAIMTTLVWLVVSAGFTWYLGNFANYNATYGSLGAVVGFMMWVWISSLIFIIGAEVNAEMEHQTALDTTDAPEKPLGARGARVADTIGRNSSRRKS